MSGLAEALVAAQAEMPSVEPDAVNPHFKSKFVSLDHLIAKTRPVLNRHGLSISQWPSYGYNGGTEAIPMLTTIIRHSSGEEMKSTMPLLLGKNDMQGLGGAITYARRYAWAAALGISADEDDDGETAVAQPKRDRRQEPTQEPTGAAEKAREAQAKAQASPAATEAEIAAYREMVEANGFDYALASKAFSDPPTRDEVQKATGELVDVLARMAEKAKA